MNMSKSYIPVGLVAIAFSAAWSYVPDAHQESDEFNVVVAEWFAHAEIERLDGLRREREQYCMRHAAMADAIAAGEMGLVAATDEMLAYVAVHYTACLAGLHHTDETPGRVRMARNLLFDAMSRHKLSDAHLDALVEEMETLLGNGNP